MSRLTIPPLITSRKNSLVNMNANDKTIEMKNGSAIAAKESDAIRGSDLEAASSGPIKPDLLNPPQSSKSEEWIEKPLSQAEKDAKFLEAHKALARLMKLRKKKHRNQNAGAFGGVGTKRKGKKKLARYLERNTVL